MQQIGYYKAVFTVNNFFFSFRVAATKMCYGNQ